LQLYEGSYSKFMKPEFAKLGFGFAKLNGRFVLVFRNYQALYVEAQIKNALDKRNVERGLPVEDNQDRIRKLYEGRKRHIVLEFNEEED
jgi:hypothetical protein